MPGTAWLSPTVPGRPFHMTASANALLPLLQQVLLGRGITCTLDGDELVLDSGLRLSPHSPGCRC